MTHQEATRRALLIGGAALSAAPLFARAADVADRRYAVLSILGDQVTLVGYRTPTGSRLDSNDRRVVPITAPVLDNSALLAVDDAVKRTQPGATTTLLASRDPKLFALRDKPLDQPADAAEAISAIKTLAQQSKATRLILVAPYRSEARFQLRDNLIGSGQLSGLGFYIDRVTRIQLIASGETGDGYLAPYAYFSLSLVDTSTMATIRRIVLTESTLIPTSAAKGATVPWEALTDAQKVEQLQSLIDQGVARAIPELLATA